MPNHRFPLDRPSRLRFAPRLRARGKGGKPPLHPQPLRAAATPLVLRRREAASKHARTAPPPHAKPPVPAASPFEAPLRSAPQGEGERRETTTPSAAPPRRRHLPRAEAPKRPRSTPAPRRRRMPNHRFPLHRPSRLRSAPPPPPSLPLTSPFEAPLRSAPQGEGERRETTTPSAAPPRRRRLPRAEAPRSGLEARPHRAAASCQTSRSR